MRQRVLPRQGRESINPLRAFQHAVALHDQGRLLQAAQLYEVVIEADDRHFGALYRLGLLRIQHGKFEDAERLFRRAAKLDKRSADAQFHLAAALTGLNRLEEAVVHYQKALNSRRSFAEAHNNLGYTLQRLGRHEEAASHYVKALAINPAYAEARNNLGGALQMLGRSEQALAQFEKALAIKPSYAEAHNNLGNVLGTLGRSAEAIAHHEKALAIRPRYPEAHHSLGSALRALERNEEAISQFQKALALDPANAGFYESLGGALEVLGRREEAIAAWNRAVALRPDDAEAHARLGHALSGVGRPQEARESHERAVALNHARAARALESAIAAIKARPAGGIRYGRRGRSANCMVAHPKFGQCWLKVIWAPGAEVNPFFWDGELLSRGLEHVLRPEIFEHFDWHADGHCYRAILMGVAPRTVSSQAYPVSIPALEPSWWRHLADALANLQTKQTDRVYVTEADLTERLQRRFGLRLRLPFKCWQTVHGDLQWSNLTEQPLSILDWETWGRAPYGFDVARLHVFSIAAPGLLAELKKQFSPVMTRPEYDIAFLFDASAQIQAFELVGGFPAIQAELRREVKAVLAERRFAAFCE